MTGAAEAVGDDAGGVVVQALSAITALDASKLRRCIENEDIGMWLLMLEAAVALFLLVFIVWWTASGRKPDRPPRRESSPPDDKPKD